MPCSACSPATRVAHDVHTLGMKTYRVTGKFELVTIISLLFDSPSVGAVATHQHPIQAAMLAVIVVEAGFVQ